MVPDPHGRWHQPQWPTARHLAGRGKEFVPQAIEGDAAHEHVVALPSSTTTTSNASAAIVCRASARRQSCNCSGRA